MLVLVVLFVLFIVQNMLVLFFEFRQPAKTVAWLLIMTLIPIIGFVLYYYLAQEFSKRRKVRRSSDITASENRKLSETSPSSAAALTKFEEMVNGSGLAESEDVVDSKDLPGHLAGRYPRLFKYLGRMTDAPITSGNDVEVYADGKRTFDAMFAAMEAARDHIHVLFYIIRSDHVGRRFQELWMRKARSGVKVRIVYDGVGSYQLGDDYIAELIGAGVEVHNFLPPLIAFFDKRVNYRNHRKIVVVDGDEAFIGGFNIGAEYVGGDPKLGFWRDTHLKISGAAVRHIQEIFMYDWTLASGSVIEHREAYYPKDDIRHGSEVAQVIASGPDKHSDAILETFFAMIAAAHESVYITTPYFIPDPSIAMALRTAADGGLDVRIIFPKTPDSRLVHWGSLSYIEEMMQAGVKCYMYHKGFIHSKVILVDRVIASVGTANMDMRSFFSNFELNAVLFDGEAVQKLLADYMGDLQDAKLLDLEQLQKRSALHKLGEIGARLLSPLL